eukprot:CAMPEP_0172496218 /NCGR_PEP_ID=MMETSP1066-20121228/83550_1 /TAXON_ID=671091 /ORGANISM="Coscinodiscus wailesii, Strain CCMP2513" /LENGTH=80 /DNA_ID=CAMNT_0013268399 /DNA_START=278 /DNA_END=518 /DNA_ORIENTATION=-
MKQIVDTIQARCRDEWLVEVIIAMSEDCESANIVGRFSSTVIINVTVRPSQASLSGSMSYDDDTTSSSRKEIQTLKQPIW